MMEVLCSKWSILTTYYKGMVWNVRKLIKCGLKKVGVTNDEFCKKNERNKTVTVMWVVQGSNK